MLAGVPGWVQALVLGIVQGLTEFIPVSSSGHLVLVPALAGWERHGLAFDVALHVGTLVALLVYYRADLWGMLRAVFSRVHTPDRALYRRLAGLLVLGSVPVAVAGVALGDRVERAFAAPVATAWLLLGTAAVLVGGEQVRRRRAARAGEREPAATAPEASFGRDPGDPAGVGIDRIGIRHALLVGGAQAFALLPGLSRSGLTISAGIGAGMARPAATRFAFLLGLPAIAGAAIVQLPELRDAGGVAAVDLAVGVVAAAVSGYLAIAFLVRLVARAGIDRFAWYVVPVSLLALVVLR